MSVFMNFYNPGEVRKIVNNSINYLTELKQMKVWICWNFVDKDGRPTKVPCAASGAKTGTNEEYHDTWVTFDEAKAAAAEKQYSGVGFVIPEGWFFLDIDHRPLDDPYVVKMLERFGSYAEKSVSGEGIHIYGKCNFSVIPTERTGNGKLKLDRRYYQKNPHNSTELYIGGLTNRYAVFTENVIQEGTRARPLIDCTEAILTTLEEDMKREAKESESLRSPLAGCGNPPVITTGCKRKGIPTVAQPLPRNDSIESIIASLRKQKNSDKFRRLYDDGDFTGYGSQSEADCALCAMIAFRTGPDPDAIGEIFRGSALYREKWERDDYREETITKGIEACNGVYHRTLMPHLDFIRFKDKTGEPYVVVPLLAQHVRDHLQYLLVRDNGKQGLLKYVYEGGVYKLYADEMFKGCIKKFIEDYDPELVKIKQVNEAFQHIITDRNYISQDELNAREDIINFRNGLLVVNDQELRLIPHDPAVYSTIQIPCDWTGERSDTPVFADYLKTLTNGDREIAQLLLQFMGVCLSNVKGWRMKKSLFLVGDGDTGKSQLKSLVERLLGKGNFISTDLSEIEARFGTGAIYGTRLAGSSDMSFMTVGELKTFKKLTGGDSVFAEFKGIQGFEFTYGGLLWFCMNRLPKFGGDDGKWVYNRIMVVNCPNVIEPARQDKQLLDKMYAEREGIIYLAVRALQKVLQNGFRCDEPASVTEAREQYMADNNTVISFYHECMRERMSDKIRDRCTASVIYDVYKAWCSDNNNGYAKTAREFRDTICTIVGGEYKDLTVHTKIGTCYRTLTLTEEAKDQYRRVYPGDSVHDDFLR